MAVRRAIVVVGLLLVVACAAGACSGSDGGASGGRGRGSAGGGSGASGSPGAGAGSSSGGSGSTPSPEAVTESEASELVAALDGRFPASDEADACVTEGLVADPELAVAVGEAGDGGVLPDGLLSLGAQCLVEVRAVPAFVSALDGEVAGGLSEEQLVCVTEGYLALPDGAVAAAQADALGLEADAAEAAKVGEMVQGCGVDVGA